MEMIIDYKTLKATIDELVEHNQTHLVNELLEILANNEIQKPEKHNRKEDINTSRFNVDLNDDQITEIIDFLQDLQIRFLGDTADEEAKYYYYSELLDQWIV